MVGKRREPAVADEKVVVLAQAHLQEHVSDEAVAELLNDNSCCPEVAALRLVPSGMAFITRVFISENRPSTRKA
jgi:hypothetical protein